MNPNQQADGAPVDLLLTGGVVVSMDSARRVFDPGFVAISGDTIVAAGPQAGGARIRARKTISAAGKVILPGLVNCHTHPSNGIHRGLYDELPLAQWVDEGMWPVARSNTPERVYAGARVTIAENLLGGVTTLVVGELGPPNTNAIEGVLDAITESRMRAVVARMSVDSQESADPSQAIAEDIRETVDHALSEVSRLRAAYDSDLIEVVPEPLGVLRCSQEMVQAMAEYARAEGTRMTMHMASSPDEIAESRRRYGMGPIDRLAELGVLGPGLLLAHCVLVSEREARHLSQAGTGVSHNPVSNLMYATGTAPLAELIDAGIAVGLGTDGSTTNNGQNMWETMKMAMFLQKARFDATWGSAELALELATIGGARAIGMQDSIGSIEAGKQADLIMVDLDVPQHLPRATWPSNIVYSHEHTAVDTVIVAGQPLVSGRELLGWDMPQVAVAANRAADEVNAATGLADRHRRRSRWTWTGRPDASGEQR